MPFVDLAFRLTGSKVAVDHGYALYSAISGLIPEIHDAKNIGVHPNRGTYSGNGELMLRDSSRLVVRMESEQIGQFLKLAGKKLEIDSCSFRVGVPEGRVLRLESCNYRFPTSCLNYAYNNFRRAKEESLNDLVQCTLWHLYEMFDPTRKEKIYEKAAYHIKNFRENMDEISIKIPREYE